MPVAAPSPDPLPQVLVIAVDDAMQRQVVLDVAGAHGLGATVIAEGERVDRAIDGMARCDENRLWIVDLVRMHRETLLPAELNVLMRRVHPHAWLLLSHAARIAIDPWARSWARNRGAIGLVPSLSGQRPVAIQACLKPAIEMLGVAWCHAPAMSSLEALDGGGCRPPARVNEHRMLSELEARGLDLESLASWAASAAGFGLADRVWRGTTYRSVFVGRAAVDMLAAHLGIERAAAVPLGELLRRSRVFRHVMNEHAFADDELFYRFTPVTGRLERLSLAHLLSHASGRGGFELRDRLYLGRTYRRCLVGSEAVEWMQRHYALDVEEALTAGQALMDLGVLAHVVDAHEFRNAALFYEWRGFARAMVPDD